MLSGKQMVLYGHTLFTFGSACPLNFTCKTFLEQKISIQSGIVNYALKISSQQGMFYNEFFQLQQVYNALFPVNNVPPWLNQ